MRNPHPCVPQNPSHLPGGLGSRALGARFPRGVETGPYISRGVSKGGGGGGGRGYVLGTHFWSLLRL